jgi:hypothetical protein
MIHQLYKRLTALYHIPGDQNDEDKVIYTHYESNKFISFPIFINIKLCIYIYSNIYNDRGRCAIYGSGELRRLECDVPESPICGDLLLILGERRIAGSSGTFKCSGTGVGVFDIERVRGREGTGKGS